MASIYGEPAVIRRIEQRSTVHKVTSNGTIAAAVMVFAAIAAVITANSPAYEVIEEVLHAPLSLGIGPATFSITIEAAERLPHGHLLLAGGH